MRVKFSQSMCVAKIFCRLTRMAFFKGIFKSTLLIWPFLKIISTIHDFSDGSQAVYYPIMLSRMIALSIPIDICVSKGNNCRLVVEVYVT